MKIANHLYPKKLHHFVKKTLVLSLSYLFTVASFANPVLDNIAGGNVSISQQPGSTVINQTSPKAIINWRSFNIGSSESTSFQQPAGGIALNRISPTDGPSSIYGRLSATGQLILINPAGIFFGPTASVNVGGLIASTANISDNDFMNGNYNFVQDPAYDGAIINKGSLIAADHGLIALVGSNVTNDGMIQANLGHVVLATGGSFTMSFAGNDLINFSVTSPAKTGRISNTGSLIADGGKIMVSANTASNVLDNAINMEGVAQARSVGVRNGEIIISANNDAGGIVRIAGKIDASGKRAGEHGGKVTVTGHNILLDSNSLIDVSGDAGGGDVNIGGSYKGQGPLPNANAVVMLPTASIVADALNSGNGGNVILWSDNVTKAYGKISARGGATAGDGGFIETSSKNYLDVNGISIDTSSPLGMVGTWLLDPTNIYIADSQIEATTGGMIGTDTSVNSSGPTVFTAGSVTDSLLLTATLNAALANNNVTVNTTSGGAGAGNINILGNIAWTSANSLTLIADNNIVIDRFAGGLANAANITAPNGSLILQAANTANSIQASNSGAINLANFNLLQGGWLQVSNPLPVFNVTNNFQIASGARTPTNVSFLRALSGSGTTVSPYILTDIFGLQGINSSATLRGNSFTLNNNIDASVTRNWNSGAGFVPIGNTGSVYTGTFNGALHTISNLYIYRPADNQIGLFGQTQNPTIHDLILDFPVVTGGSNTGTLIGAARNGGTLFDLAATNITVTGTGNGVGGLIGQLGANLSRSYTTGAVTAIGGSGTFWIGGLVGISNQLAGVGTIANSYSSVNVNGGTANLIGGLVGFNNNLDTITNSYSTGLVAGTATDHGGLFGLNNLATITSTYWNTDTSGQSTSGTFGGGTASNTASMFNQSTYTGWNFATIWGIIPGQSYPYLRVFYTSPQAISGNSPAASSISGNNTVTLAAAGTNIATTYTGANGFYYFLLPNGTVPNGPILSYVSSGSNLGNAVGILSGGGSVSNTSGGLAITANQVTAGQTVDAITMSNSDLITAKGGLTSNILYSSSGTNLVLLPGISFSVPNVNTTYNLNGSITASSGNISFAGLINLTTDVLLSAANISLNNAINGANNLTLSATTSTGLTTVGATTPLTSLTINAPSSTTITGGTVNTVGSQTYNTPVTVTTDTAFTSSAPGNIAFNQGLGGGANVSVSAASATYAGNLSLNSITSDSMGSADTLSIDSGSAQNWIITGSDSGSITGIPGIGAFNFSGTENLSGGASNDNTFTFANGATLSGTINGGSLAHANTLNYVAYQSPITVLLTALNNGMTTNQSGGTITNFININHLIATFANNNTLTFPNKTNNIVFTNVLNGEGYVNDPTYFSGFNSFISTGGNNTVLLPLGSSPFMNFSSNPFVLNQNGTNIFFYNFNQSDFISAATGISNATTTSSYGVQVIDNQYIMSDVGANIDDLVTQLEKEFDDQLTNRTINPYCYAANT